MNTQKGFSSLFGLSILIVVVGVSLFLYIEKTSKEIPEIDVTPMKIEEIDNVEKPKSNLQANVTYSIQKDTLYVLNNDVVVDTLVVNEDAEAGIVMIENQSGEQLENKRFILYHDVNYDGYTDAAVLTGIGYGGVNYFYDYYVYNSQTQRLERSDVLINLGNPVFDSVNKRITTSYRSGPQWYEVRFQWDGSSYLEVQASPGPEEVN